MEGVETLLRKSNMKFFLFLSERNTIRSAAKDAGLSVQHATRLLKKWRDKGLVEKTGLYGHKYSYTDEGRHIHECLVHARCFL